MLCAWRVVLTRASAQLLDALVKNCGATAHKRVHDQKLLGVIVDMAIQGGQVPSNEQRAEAAARARADSACCLVGDGGQAPEVTNKALALLRKWAESFRNSADFPFFQAAFRSLASRNIKVPARMHVHTRARTRGLGDETRSVPPARRVV